MIGDAGLTSDPVWGVGCGWAFQTAEWLVEYTADAFGSASTLDRSLERYSKRHRSELMGHHRLMADYSKGRPLNPLERLMFSAAARDPAMARHLLEFGGRLIRPSQFLAPRAVSRAARVNLANGRRGRRAA